jgi:hypothetical protein
VLLAVTVLAAVGVLGTGSSAIALGAFCLYFSLGVPTNIHYLDNENAALLAFTPLTIFIPMWQTFRREMCIQNELAEQKKDLSKELQAALPTLKEYYQRNQKELLGKLEAHLSAADKAYTNEKSNPVHNAVCLEQPRVLFHEANDALNEMRKAAEFYSSL